MTPGLRERRKQQTRQAISDMATGMFAARGFDHVTIAEVAEAAGVAKMTVTNYFPRKEDLVFDRAERIIRHLADVVTARAPGESMLAAIRRDYAESVARADVTLGLSSPAFAQMIADSPVLISRGLEMLEQREQALGDAIAADLGDGGPQPRVVAALLTSVHRVLYKEAARRSLAGQPRTEICGWLAGAATAAFDLLEPALGGYGVRPGRVASAPGRGPGRWPRGRRQPGRRTARPPARDCGPASPRRPGIRRSRAPPSWPPAAGVPRGPAERCRTSTSRPAASPAIPPATSAAWSPETEAACRAWPRAGAGGTGRGMEDRPGLAPGQAAGPAGPGPGTPSRAIPAVARVANTVPSRATPNAYPSWRIVFTAPPAIPPRWTGTAAMVAAPALEASPTPAPATAKPTT